MAQSEYPVCRTILSILLIAAVISISLSPVLGQRATIRADVDLVVVPTSVKDFPRVLISQPNLIVPRLTSR